MRQSKRRKTCRKKSAKLMPFREPTLQQSQLPFQDFRVLEDQDFTVRVKAFSIRSVFGSKSVGVPCMNHDAVCLFCLISLWEQLTANCSLRKHPFSPTGGEQIQNQFMSFSCSVCLPSQQSTSSWLLIHRMQNQYHTSLRKQTSREWCVAVFFCMQSLRYSQ